MSNSKLDPVLIKHWHSQLEDEWKLRGGQGRAEQSEEQMWIRAMCIASSALMEAMEREVKSSIVVAQQIWPTTWKLATRLNTSLWKNRKDRSRVSSTTLLLKQNLCQSGQSRVKNGKKLMMALAKWFCKSSRSSLILWTLRQKRTLLCAKLVKNKSLWPFLLDSVTFFTQFLQPFKTIVNTNVFDTLTALARLPWGASAVFHWAQRLIFESK